MGVTEYARHRGCELRAVQFAIQRGRITKDANGLIDSDKADRDWERNTNHAQARYGKKRRDRDPASDVQGGKTRAATWAAKHKAAESAAATQSDPDRLSSSMSFANARAAKEIYEARLKKIELEERLGNLLSRKAVEVAQYNRGRIIRDALMNIPNRIAAQLAAETDPAACHDLLEAEIRMVLEEFSGGKLG